MIPSPLFQSLGKVWEGLKITFLGIGMVFLVLSVLSVVIYLVGQAIYRAVSKEKKLKAPKVPKKVKEIPKPVKVAERREGPLDEEIAAVIGAAIAAYLYLRAKAPVPKEAKGGGAKDLWSLASKIEAMMPEVEVTRENLDEILVKEGIWR